MNKTKAYTAVAKAVRGGFIPPPDTLDCTTCPKKAQLYHHADYACPLDVVPLCSGCHVAAHQQICFDTYFKTILVNSDNNMKTITATAWRRMAGREMEKALEEGPLLITSNGKPLYEIHEPIRSYVQEMTVGQWKRVPGWDIEPLLRYSPMLVLRGKRPLFEARRISE